MTQYPHPESASQEETRPGRRTAGLDAYQPIRVAQPPRLPEVRRKPGRDRRRLWILLAVFLAVYFLFPLRTNVLILGTDDMPHRGTLGRTDTMILTTVIPFKPYVGMLSIPRDLWVDLPGVGANRINAAYYFAEAGQAGSGPGAAMDTVRTNFGVTVDYFVLIRMYGVVDVIDALGGVDITLERSLGGLPPGSHHLDGTQALAFARERYSADDIARLAQGQLLIRALLKKGLSPAAWLRWPLVMVAAARAVETDIPILLWPRLGLALLRAGPEGMDARVITREMVSPFTTGGGGQVLGPNWEAINPVLLEMFGE